MIKRFVQFNRRLSARLLRRWPATFGGDNCTEELMRRIRNDIATTKPTRILECGGIDRPLLGKNPAYTYIGLDIEERTECHSVYNEFLVQSVEDPIAATADMVISTTLLEHVPNNRHAVRRMHDALRPGGATHHYIPSKHHPYSILLRLLGPHLQRKLIALLRPEGMEVSGYPAFFDHCSPRHMQRVFEDAGFEQIDVKAFYRANDYFEFFVPGYLLITGFENACRRFKWTYFCSGFVISAVRASEKRSP